MFILVLVGLFVVAFLMLVALLWGLSKVLDKEIKGYINYAKEGKEHGRR